MLRAGQSELDSVVLRLVDKNVEITTWDRFNLRQDFLTPTVGWEFTSSAETPLIGQELFQEGSLVEISINDRLQCTGYLEKVSIRQNREGGLVYVLSGRDILGPVVSGNIDPQIKIAPSMSVEDFLSAILITFGIDTIYNSDALNLNIITGIGKNISQTKQQRQAKQAISVAVINEDNTASEIKFQTTPIVSVVAGNRVDLKTLKLDQIKPRIGEGAYQLMDRIISRLGYRVWAAADGTGVIVDQPDFQSPAKHKLIRKKTNPQNNNIQDGDCNYNIEAQPSCVVVTGNSTTSDDEVVTLKVIAVNELVGFNAPDSPVQNVLNIISRYKQAKILPFRSQLYPKQRRISQNYSPVPMFLKDDEAKTLAQLQSFARKQLSLKQKEYLTLSYTVEGFSYPNGTQRLPWAVNTLVDVDDDVFGIHEPMWVLGKTFIKGRDGGTYTELSLIKPYTLELGA
jgi:prophage tail gpP-like protein